jgi:tetratricopeptide (TPR) repeat protein
MGDAQMIQIVVNRHASSPTAVPSHSVPASELAIPEKARELYRKGMKELDRRKYDKSIEHFRAAIQEYPDYASAYSSIGIAHIQMRQSNLAQAAFEKALSLNAQSTEAHLGMGLVYNDQQKFVEAEKHLLKAQQLTPADWHVHYELGRAYYGMDKLEQAEKSLRLARQTHPEYGNLYLLLANALVLQNKYAEGLAEMKEFLNVSPDSPLAPQVKEKIKLLKAEIGQP